MNGKLFAISFFLIFALSGIPGIGYNGQLERVPCKNDFYFDLSCTSDTDTFIAWAEYPNYFIKPFNYFIDGPRQLRAVTAETWETMKIGELLDILLWISVSFLVAFYGPKIINSSSSAKKPEKGKK